MFRRLRVVPVNRGPFLNKQSQIDLLKKYRIPIRGQSGQHLLIDPNLQKKLTSLLPAQSGETVLEIGPGLGALTSRFLEAGVRVVAVEKDSRFVEILRDVFAEEIDNELFVVLNADVLETNLEQLIHDYDIHGVISNLPYYITGPVLFQVFAVSGFLHEGVFMMQKEVADRILSEPGSKEYGRLSVLSRYYARIQHGCDVPPKCFAPPPEVHSTVLHFDFSEGLRNRYPVDPVKFEAFIKISFAQRRKILMSVLKKQTAHNLAPEAWQDAFKACGIEPNLRPEQISPEAFLALAGLVLS